MDNEQSIEVIEWLKGVKHYLDQKILSIEHSQFTIEHCNKQVKNSLLLKSANQAQMNIDIEAVNRQIKTAETYIGNNCAEWDGETTRTVRELFEQIKGVQAALDGNTANTTSWPTVPVDENESMTKG